MSVKTTKEDRPRPIRAEDDNRFEDPGGLAPLKPDDASMLAVLASRAGRVKPGAK